MDSAQDLERSRLVAKVHRLAEEIVRAKRELTVSGQFDARLVALLSHCFDRLDDIGSIIGAMEVDRIARAAADHKA